MKKLLALCAAAALALGIAGCANEDATLSVDAALASTKLVAAYEDAIVSGFSLSATESELYAGTSAKITPKFANNFYTVLTEKAAKKVTDDSKIIVIGAVKAESANEDVATATVGDDNAVTIKGVGKGETTLSISLEIEDGTVETHEVAVTVKEGAGVQFAGLTTASGEDVKKPKSLEGTSIKIAGDDTAYLSATELEYKKKWTGNDTGFIYNSSNSETRVSAAADDDKFSVAAMGEVGRVFTTITANADVQLTAYAAKAGVNGKEGRARLQIYTIADDESKTETLVFDTGTDAKPSTTLGKPDSIEGSITKDNDGSTLITLKKDKKIKVVLICCSNGAQNNWKGGISLQDLTILCAPAK